MIAIIGARSKDLLLFENELKSFCDEVLISTDDGSYGHKGFVTDLLKDRLEKDQEGSGSRCRWSGAHDASRSGHDAPFGVATTVSLNSLMVDGIGMCGACPRDG